MKPFGSKRLTTQETFPPLSLRAMMYSKGGGDCDIHELKYLMFDKARKKD